MMTDALDNFRCWYVEPLHSLFSNRKAGFPILLIAFPMLERYLRQRVGIGGQAPVNDAFYEALVDLFPELKDREIGQTFWKIYRHGLLHEVSLSRASRTGRTLPAAWLSHETPTFSIDSDGDFWINPVPFATRIIDAIEENFSVFENGSKSVQRFPRVISVAKSFGTATGIDPAEIIVTGTCAGPNEG